jgi:hypothetical protein
VLRPHFDFRKICAHPERLYVPLTAVLALSSAGCDFESLSTRPGKHVVYHWEADERWLCGGTVRYADQLAETMAGRYGMSLDGDGGPTVEYFWSVGDVGSLSCNARGACVWPTPTTRNRWLSSVYSEMPIHGHELAHAVVGSSSHGLPLFVNEGLAVRWQSAVLGEGLSPTRPLVLDEAQLRAQIDDKLFTLHSDAEYEAAFVWFAALEWSFGPEKMGEFLRSLNAMSSSDKVDEALQRTMGISLAGSVVLAASYLPMTFDDPVCDMQGVPVIRWEGEAIVIDRRDAHCADEDVVNWHSRVKSIFIFESSDNLHRVNVNVTVSGASDRLSIQLQHCPGGAHQGSSGAWIDGASANTGTWEMDLRGRWVASLLGDIDDDGNVMLPRVEFTPVQP